jgi:hypothetical protein
MHPYPYKMQNTGLELKASNPKLMVFGSTKSTKHDNGNAKNEKNVVLVEHWIWKKLLV